MNDLVVKARAFAIQAHDVDANQKYNGMPYSYHLGMVVGVAEDHIHCIAPAWHGEVLAACWLHDAIEDARITYSTLRHEFSAEVADLVYACTNEKGRTRKERANDKFYQELRATPYACFVKMCDRIANVQFSVKHNSPQVAMYRKENDYFIQRLELHPNNPLVLRLKALFHALTEQQ